MSTRGRLGIELADESILSIYNHFDSYPEFLGVKLVKHFNSRDAVTELIDGGDISALWTNVGWNNETLPETGPLPYSSRGEDCPPRLDADLCEYLLPDGCEEYHYIFTQNNQWVCYNMNQFDNTKLPEVVEIPVPAVV
jgi:hypothetical protein